MRISSLKSSFPFTGIAASAILLTIAASRYPGGTTFDRHTSGFAWTHNFISSLFQPTALNGAANPARSFAILAMLALCLSLGFAFKRISILANSVSDRKAIEIGGVGSMVYAFLAVTPLHNLMVNVALLFYIVAVAAIMHCLYINRIERLFIVGAVVHLLLVSSAIIYYGNFIYWLLPTLQKLTYIGCVAWILAVYQRSLREQPLSAGSHYP